MKDIVSAVFLLVAALAIYALFTALPVMLLWNWLVPDLFRLGTINFLQAFGLVVLCGALFKSSTSSKK